MDTLLVNIDEWSINRNTKLKYSWGFKGFPIESQNTLFRGSISIVLAICSNGSFISFAINETINSENFMWFLSIMNNWLETNNYFGYSKTWIIDWSINKSRSTKSLFERMKYQIFCIPPYTPDFAQVKMTFSNIKWSLSNIWKHHSYNNIER